MFLQHLPGAGAVLALPAVEGTRVAVHEVHVLPKHVRPHEAFRALATRERFGLGQIDDLIIFITLYKFSYPHITFNFGKK